MSLIPTNCLVHPRYILKRLLTHTHTRARMHAHCTHLDSAKYPYHWQIPLPSSAPASRTHTTDSAGSLVGTDIMGPEDLSVAVRGLLEQAAYSEDRGGDGLRHRHGGGGQSRGGAGSGSGSGGTLPQAPPSSTTRTLYAGRRKASKLPLSPALLKASDQLGGA